MFGLRLRLMSALDWVFHRRSSAAAAALVAADDAARLERVGPSEEAVANLRAFVKSG